MHHKLLNGFENGARCEFLSRTPDPLTWSLIQWKTPLIPIPGLWPQIPWQWSRIPPFLRPLIADSIYLVTTLPKDALSCHCVKERVGLTPWRLAITLKTAKTTIWNKRFNLLLFMLRFPGNPMIFTPIENKPSNLPTKVVIALHICEQIDLQVALLLFN